MKKRSLVFVLILTIFSFIFIANVKAEKLDPPTFISAEKYLSDSVKLNYNLDGCKYENCGIMVLNLEWYKEGKIGSIKLREKSNQELIWQELEKGKTYHFLLAVYWFDEDGILKNGVWSDSKSVNLDGEVTKTATDLEIITPAEKIEYFENDKFDPTGMKVRITYNIGVQEELENLSSCTFNPETILKNTTKVKVTCNGVSAYQNITVKEKIIEEIIEVISNPNKTIYEENTPFDPTGMKIKAKYNSGEIKDLDVTSDICKFNPSSLSINTDKVIVTCGNATTNVNVTVNKKEKALASIEIKDSPNKISYIEGELFDPTGMTLNGVYNDETTEILNVKDEVEKGTCEIIPNTTLTSDITNVKIKCNDLEVTQDITVKKMVTANVIVQNGTVETSSKTIEYNTSTTFNITPAQEDYTYGYVSCTNNQNGTYNNGALTLNNVTKDTTCTVKLVNEMTTLYADGTLIINEQLKDRTSNIEKHGEITNNYVAMDNDNSYIFNCTYTTKTSCNTPWYNERENVKSVEIGKTIKPTSTAYWFYAFVNMEKGDFTNLDTSNVTDMNSMFIYAGQDATTFNLIGLNDFDTSQVTNMKSMFQTAGHNASTFNLDLSNWDTSNVTNMKYMFWAAGNKATTWSVGDLSNWDTSKVTNMIYMFNNTGGNATTFSLDISNWNTSNVASMNGMFGSAGSSATTFNLDLSSWDTSSVTDMSSMFSNAGGDATTWNIGDISNWNTSNVTNMNYMFYAASQKATTFNLDLSSWDTSNVTNMDNMFCKAGTYVTTFNLNLSNWDTSNVTNMHGMFFEAGSYKATTFNLDLSNWDTSNVTNMSQMFSYAGSKATTWTVKIPSITGNLSNTTSKWYGSSEDIYASPASNRYFTLSGSEVKKTLTSIEVKDSPNKTSYTEGELFDPTGMTLNGIYNDETTEVLNVKDEVEKGTCEIIPNTALTSDITSVKIKCNDLEVTQDITVKKMVTANVIVQNGTVETSSKTLEYNTGASFNITPAQEDYTYGYVSCTNNQNGTYNNGVLTLTNVTSDTTCTVKLVNEMTTLYTDGTLIINEQLKDRTSNIEKHGEITNNYVAMDNDNSYTFDSSKSSLWYSERNNIKSVEIGKTIKPTSTAYWFYDFTNMEKGDFTNLDTSNVTDMDSMFNKAGYNATTWNIGDISSWNTSNVTDMEYMFLEAGYKATTFNLNLSNWDTSKVTDMHYMFDSAGYNATNFSLTGLNNWDISNVMDMSYMFRSAGCKATTWSIGDLSNWNTSKVTDMNNMFSYVGTNVTTFNLDLSNWDTSNVANMNDMFYWAGLEATTWNIGDLSNWNTSKVTDMSGMFSTTGQNDKTWSIGDLSNWDTSNVTSMFQMFYWAGYSATTWNVGDLSNWDTSSVTGMSSMFYYAGYSATSWSIGDLSNWDTSNVTSMFQMFDSAGYNATTWNVGDISNWNTSSVTNMERLFSEAGYNATTFNLNLSNWNTSNVTSMSQMLFCAGYKATTFDLDLSNWDTSNVTNMREMFGNAGYKATTWTVKIPSMTGSLTNTTNKWYGSSEDIYTSPSASNRYFTLSGNEVKKALASIEIKDSPNKTSYIEGELFDPTGMTLNGIYNDETTEVLNVKDEVEKGTCEIIPNTALTTDITSIKIKCNDLEVTQEITVNKMVTANVIVQNGTVETSSKTLEYNTSSIFNITPIQDDYMYGYVSCTNDQNGTYDNGILTLNNVTSDTTCTIKLVNEMTTLYTDGTFIINEQLKDRSTNMEKHGEVTNNYIAMDGDYPYVFEMNSGVVTSPWSDERESIKNVEIGKTIKPTSTAYWFYDFTNMEKGDFTNLDTSNVTDMNRMFASAGEKSNTFILTGLDNWNTSNVTNMSYMFTSAGKNATTWNVGDISSWNVTNVTDMRNMFWGAGSNTSKFNLDLSGWDTSNVTNMSYMFEFSGTNSSTFNLDLSNWDTSNVTDMNHMFSEVGTYATSWSIGDLSSWDTSNVTNMSYMFREAGSNASTWSIGNLSSWNTSNVSDMRSMFWGAGQNATAWNIGDISNWNTSSVTDMSGMFYNAGYKATTFSLDLSNWDTSSVTDMNNMFSYAGIYATSWTVKIPATTGSLSNTTDKWYGSSENIYAEPLSGKSFTLS